MANEPQSFEIDGHTFEVYPLMGREALRLARRLSSYLSGILAIGASAQSEEDISVSDLQQGIEQFFRNCSEKEFEEFADKMYSKMTMDGRKLDKDWNTIFMGEMGLMFKSLMESVKIQFKDFFSILENSVPSKMPTTTPKKPSRLID